MNRLASLRMKQHTLRSEEKRSLRATAAEIRSIAATLPMHATESRRVMLLVAWRLEGWSA